MSNIKVEGLKLLDEQIYEFIPPSPTENERGGITASEKTDSDTVEVAVDSSTGRAYVPAYPTEIENAIHAESSDTATKATQDASGNVITSTYETKTDASAKLTEAKTYAETVVASKADTSDLTSHTSSKSNPHGVTLSQLGVTATSTELNTLDGITATVTELNYTDGVTSNIQTQLNGKAASSHGTHVSYGTSASALGTSSAGTASTVSRSDHVHALPALTSCTGTLTVAKGGTGSTTASGAITNLGAMDLTSAQTASGMKTFSNGIKIGSATLSYDSTNVALKITFS